MTEQWWKGKRVVDRGSRGSRGLTKGCWRWKRLEGKWCVDRGLVEGEGVEVEGQVVRKEIIA